MKVFATYREDTGDTLEVSSGRTDIGSQRVCLAAYLDKCVGEPDVVSVYLKRSEAIDMADAIKRAALSLPPE